jgi:hypothetical protein
MPTGEPKCEALRGYTGRVGRTRIARTSSSHSASVRSSRVIVGNMRASCVADEREWGIYRPPTIQPIAATAIIPIPITIPTAARASTMPAIVSAIAG